MNDGSRPITRRAWLTGVAGAMGSLAGCLDPLRRALDRDAPQQLSVQIKTLPRDEDLYALQVANHLAANLERAGAQVGVVPTRHASFLRDILVNLDFDLYVWRHPGQADPDFLRPLLHSRFAEEPGWQNPFSISNRMIDDLLEEQLISNDREATLRELQEVIVEEAPFIPVAFEHEQRIHRTDRLVHSTPEIPSDDPLWLFALSSADENATDDEDEDEDVDDEVWLGTTDWRMTHNLNPIAVEYRGPWFDPTDLIYEPLMRIVDGDPVAWLAQRWEWTSPRGARAPTLEVRLRPELTWHDGEPVTSEDVAFTFNFLQDTTMTDEDPHIPAPRFRGRTTLLDTIDVVDDAIRLQFERTTRETAIRLLTVPVLPAHIWEELTELTEVAGIPVSDVVTDALVDDNLDAIGSGPYRVVDVDTDGSLELEFVPEHPLWSEEANEPLRTITEPSIRRLIFDIRPSVSNIAGAIADGELDGTARDIGREFSRSAMDNDDAVDVVEWETTRLVHVGMNLRGAPFTMHGFREAIGRLIDREYVIEEIFEGHARATLSPVAETELVPSTLDWDPDRSPFLGESGSGEVDPEAARDQFREAGFQYAEDGSLLAR